MTRIIVAAVLSAMLAGSAVAGPWEGAIAASERGDYATAVKLIRPLAEQGFASAH